MNDKDLSKSVKAFADQLGFAGCGITGLEPIEHGDLLEHWLSSGMAADMAYMHRQASRRMDPSRILPGACRAIVLLRNHFTTDTAITTGYGRVAKYARGPDYHETLRPLLDRIEQHVRDLGDSKTITRAHVDAGPVPERELASQAGLGWIGRNSMLINPGLGSHLFLACVLTNLDLAVDAPFGVDRCGTCNRCVASCPTEAIQPDRLVDSRRCISYLTIEHKGEVRSELASRFGDLVFGCDVCQDVCPWNSKFASSAKDDVLDLDTEHGVLALEGLDTITPQEFELRFGNTALERTGSNGMRRNARIVLANQKAENTA